MKSSFSRLLLQHKTPSIPNIAQVRAATGSLGFLELRFVGDVVTPAGKEMKI